MPLPPKWYQFLVGTFASVGSILYGYDLGVIAGAIGSNAFALDFHSPNPNQTGAVVSAFTGGAFFGAGIAGPVGDWLGRRLTIMIGAVIFLLGGGLQTGAQSLNFLYGGRCIAGLGVGFLVMIIPLYQAELAHPSIRGRITSLQQFMLGIGAFVASWVAFGAYSFPNTSSLQWRLPLGIQLIPAGILALLILLFPESPRWLIDHGHADKGLKTLARLHANGDVNDPWVRAEFDQIQESITFEREHAASSYMELFRNKSSFRRLFMACAIQASIQMTGVSAIQYYSVKIFGQIGIPSNDTLKYQGISSIIALLGELSCMLFIDKIGRRPALIWGNIGNCITFIIATILLAKFPPGATHNNGASWGFIVITWAYNFCFSACCGPLSWIVPAEIFDTHTRSKGVSIATMVSFAFNTMIAQTTSVAMTSIRYRWYYLFIICNLTNAIFFWAFLPETARRPLEEMNYLFTNAPLFVPNMKKSDYEVNDLERRAQEVEHKMNVTDHVEDR